MLKVDGVGESLPGKVSRPIPCTKMILESLTMILLNHKSSILMKRLLKISSLMSWITV